ncbi:MAG: electron transfer flavoprotein subunit beta/FixA family protein [Coriobacteriia bacterium]|nr:electron transfer flavoprotein subunit beta/FixA family protein [Coriobacteriia bacterium]MCL2749815.1 electron transfer flavoprotein subunit beta/FixA family protein [Coriobacteriia bacterium]
MKCIVALKQIPDLQQLRIRNREPVLNDIPYTLGAIDKNALELGVQLKEELDWEVVVISAGNEELEDTIKEALAGGADNSFLLIDNQIDQMDSAEIASLLAEMIRRSEDIGLAIFGEGSGDNYTGQVGSRVAEILGWPQAGYATSVSVDGSTAKVTRALDDCIEEVELDLPAVIIVSAGLNTPRIPSVMQILKAGKLPKEIITLDDLSLVSSANQIETVSNLAPIAERKQIKIGSVDELLNCLESAGVERR